ncbi:hypothetical protein KIH23_12700 [Flavobacterium sp. CYK-55]|uniref:LamG-like jellyroll fold domain-containing protein n=1 Tax=Flavobacterium sp. CYK-55 TaxID=2835529 RepID=UPI001BCDA5B3|nr:LamG-like jellyroll fold domain-containing protein [Flavobacterium sp. CYK-55]MBS7788159.1 hypothetical protein [Flavobacterium sp. CYK-55]
MKTNRILLAALGLGLTMSTVVSCSSDSSSSDSLPPIGGYNSANEVGASNLKAYWPLNGNGTESKSSTNPSSTAGTTWTAGVKGQCANFSGGYLAYPAIASLNSATSMTISLWANVSNNQGTPLDGPSMFFQMTRPMDDSHDEWAGNINFMAETGWKAATVDSLTTKGLAVIKNADGSANWQDSRNTIKLDDGMITENAADPTGVQHVAYPNKNGGVWAHYVIVWDGAAGTFKVYANGQKISNPKWETRNGGNPLNLNFFANTKPLIGTFGSVLTGNADSWQKSLTGKVDEIRVWDKALSSADINSLYELEKAGR